MDRNDVNAGPGDPYPFQGGKNPYADQLQQQRKTALDALDKAELTAQQLADFEAGFKSGTTTVMAADANGWLVSVTPSGGWVPATIAGRTGIGLSQRMQSFVLDAAENPFNVVAPGKRPRVTLTPSLALKDGKPWLAFGVQGGDSQDQNLLQFFLNVQEFGMTPQEAAEAANFNSYQMKASFDQHESQPGRIVLNSVDAAVGHAGTDRARLQARVRSPHLRPDQRDHDRPGERHVLGRLEQPRRGLRHRLVAGATGFIRLNPPCWRGPAHCWH